MKRLRTAAFVAALLLGSLASTASATTITPNATTDDITNNGNCTLREAVQAANTDTAVDQCPAGSGADVIQLGAHTYDLTVTGATEDANQKGDLDVSQPVTIQGQGAAATTIDAHSNDRAIDVLSGGTTEIKSVTITNGAAPTDGTFAIGGDGEPGGAVRAQAGLTLTDVSITNSHAGAGSTGAVVPSGHRGGDGGGVWSSSGPLQVTGGSFDSDHAGNGSNGANGTPPVGGAGSPGNPGGNGGSGGNGGAIAVAGAGHLTVTGTTFNLVHAGAGGASGDGSSGKDDGAGTGGNGGAAGNAGIGGSGGAIDSAATTDLTGITATFATAGHGGDAGKGGNGGAGATPAQNGQPGANGSAGVGGEGGAVATGFADLTISGATFRNVSAGAGGAGPQDAPPSATGGTAGAGGPGGAVAALVVNVSHTLISNAHAGTGGVSGSTITTQGHAGGGGGPGGGIDGITVTVTDTTISAGQAGPGGDGAFNTSSTARSGDAGTGGGGGGVHAAGTLTMNNVELDHDNAGSGGAGGDTSVGGSNGGPGGSGGAVLADQGGTITNLTIQGDSAGQGGAGGPSANGGHGGDGGGIREAGTGLTLTHVTVFGNGPGDGGDKGSMGNPGLPGAGGGVSGPATVNDSIVAGNVGTQCVGTNNGTGNVSFPDSSCGGVNADPKLRPLADNGGSTFTRLPGPGSAALDIVPAGGADCTGADQRGVTRPQGPACDSGAVEAANPALSADGGGFGAVSQGGTLTKTVTVHATFDPLHPVVALTSLDFAIVSDGCSGVALVPGGTCPVQIRFTAGSAPGPRSATLHLTHDAAGPALDAPLSATVVDTAPPVLSGLTLTYRTFRVAKRKPAPKGTAIRFSLSEASSVKFAVTQKRPGRRKGKRCVAPTRKLRHARKCTRTVTLGTFTRNLPAGTARVPFSGRLKGRKLKPGSYMLTLTPTDPPGNHGRSASIRFKVVKR